MDLYIIVSSTVADLQGKVKYLEEQDKSQKEEVLHVLISKFR